MFSMKRWKFGIEHEWADIPRNERLPVGYGWDIKDCTIVNSNGIANDPSGKLYGFGGEINTPPMETCLGQVSCLEHLLYFYIGRAERQNLVNYRSNLHIHISVPGLREDLPALKRISAYNNRWLKRVLEFVEPISTPQKYQFFHDNVYAGAMRRYRRRLVSHHTVLTEARAALQQGCTSVEQFFEAEVPRTSDGKPMWHAAPRCAVNLRHLRDTPTVEFRHFPGTIDPTELLHALKWCEHYLGCALQGNLDFDPIKTFVGTPASFPTFPEYRHDLEIRYRATCHDGTLTKAQIKENIDAILAGTFDPAHWDPEL